MKPIISSLGMIALLLVALSFAVANTTAPSPTVAAATVEEAGEPLATSEEAVCTHAPEQPSGLDATAPFEQAAAGPHCCGSGAGAACRDSCKQQGPGCKGTIGCRAGECVCNCTCP